MCGTVSDMEYLPSLPVQLYLAVRSHAVANSRTLSGSGERNGMKDCVEFRREKEHEEE